MNQALKDRLKCCDNPFSQASRKDAVTNTPTTGSVNSGTSTTASSSRWKIDQNISGSFKPFGGANFAEQVLKESLIDPAGKIALTKLLAKLNRHRKARGAISRAIVVTIVAVIVVVAGIAVVGYNSLSTAPSTTASTSTNSSPTIPSTTTSTTSSLTTLSIDDLHYPGPNLNQLGNIYELPWPNWNEYTVYQALVTTNETAMFQGKPIQYLPGLATSWTPSSNYQTWTFNLRQSVNFSDGNPFNAYQVWLEEYSMYYLSFNSSTWFLGNALFDMSSVRFGPATVAMITNGGGVVNPSPAVLKVMMNSSWPIYVTGPYQIVFHLKAPFIWFPGTLVAYDGMIWDNQYVLNHGGFGKPSSRNSYFNTSPIPGTGPYVIAQFAANSFIRYTQNPTYWGRNLTPAQVAQAPALDPGHFKDVIIYQKPDDVVRYTDLSTGAVQIASISSQNWGLIQSNPSKWEWTQTPKTAEESIDLALNTKAYPTNITAVRLAIVHAINYTDIKQKIFAGNLNTYVGPEYPGWPQFYDLGNYSPYSYNVTLAKQYLAQANIKKMPTIDFAVKSSEPDSIALAVLVQGYLGKIGIPVNIEAVSGGVWYTYYSLQYASEVKPSTLAQLAQLSIVAAFVNGPVTLTPSDPWVSLVSNSSTAGNNALYSNPTVEAAVSAFTNSGNITQIQLLVQQAQSQIYNDAPYAWIGNSALWGGAGSLVWPKGMFASNFYYDPLTFGDNDMVLFNTVKLASPTG